MAKKLKHIGNRMYSDGKIIIKPNDVLEIGKDIEKEKVDYLLKTFPNWFQVIEDKVKKEVNKVLDEIDTEDKLLTDKKVKNSVKKGNK